MPNETKTISRADLYEQVWSKAMTQLAQEYGYSDVGMAKLCTKHNIPLPGRGYWAKVAAGQEPPRKKLPSPSHNPMIELTTHYRPGRTGSDADTETEPREKEVPITVGNSLRGCHPLVSTTRDVLERADTYDGMLIAPNDLPLNIRVSKKCLHRALLIFDALLKALVQRGHTVGHGPTVIIDEVGLTISLAETWTHVELEPEEQDLDGRYTFGHSRTLKKQVPSGNLALSIEEAGHYWAHGCRRMWRDGKKQRVEDILTKFAAHLHVVVESCKQHETELEKARKRKEEEKERKEERENYKNRLRRMIQDEEDKAEALLEEASDWETSQNLRAYIDAKEKNYRQKHGNKKPDAEFVQWVAWAKKQADKLDPLTETPSFEIDKVTAELSKLEEADKSEPWHPWR